MGYTVYTQEGCSECKIVCDKLQKKYGVIEILTWETLLALADPMRRADLMTLISMRERDDLPVAFRDDVLVEVEDLDI
jgi:hypothetical protein